MHATVATLLLALLLGGANGSVKERLSFEKGQFIEITVATFPNTEIDVLATQTLPNKYEYLPNTLSSCRVRINDLDESDEGLWSLHAVILSGDGTTYELKEHVNVIFGDDEAEESASPEDTDNSETLSSESPKETEEEEDPLEASQEEETADNLYNVTILSPSQYVVNLGNTIIVDVSGSGAVDGCGVTVPSGETYLHTDTLPTGMAFVVDRNIRCRLTVGPITEDMLGDWLLSGKFSDRNVFTERRPVFSIIQEDPWNPIIEDRDVEYLAQQFISTTTGASINITIDSTRSTVQSCHIRTPEGLQYTFMDGFNVPGVEQATGRNVACGVTVRMTEEMVGNWTLIVREHLNNILTERRQPFLIVIPDEDNPFEPPHDVTYLNPTQHVINLGSRITVDVSGSGVFNECEVTVPSGETYLDTDTLPTGIAFVVDRNIRCRLTVGPITEDMLGDWLLSGKFNNRNVFTERRQFFSIVQEDSLNPIEEDRDVEYLAQQLISTTTGASINITIDSTRSNVQSCHIRTPEGLQYTFMEGFNLPGVEQATGRNVACGVTVHVSKEMAGNWTLIAREHLNNVLTERRQPFIIIIPDEDNPFEPPYDVTYLNPTQYVVYLGGNITVDVSGTGVVDECQVTMPSGQTYRSSNDMPDGVDFVVDRVVRCRLTVGPITEIMLGDWLLNGKFSNRNVYTELRLRFKVIQEDPRNPIEEDRGVEYLAEQFINTTVGVSSTITMPTGRGSVQSCHIRTNEGLQYTFMEGFNVSGVEQVTERNVACGVAVHVSEDMIGLWTLIAREFLNSRPTERRLPFTI